MLMVMVIHVTIGINKTGLPDSDYLMSNPVQGVTLSFVFYFCLCCVNLFVFISGWFGIRPTILGGAKLLFQALFFVFITFLVDKIVFGRAFESVDIKALLFLNSDSGYWFVKSYLFLYILSPFLNAFIKSASKLQFKIVLISLILTQTYFDIVPATAYLSKGYSPISFCTLYLLARYISIYRPKICEWSSCGLLAVVILIPAIRTVISSGLLIFRGSPFYPMWDSYDSIILIFQTVCLFLLFERRRFYNNKINIIANSCFAVYLLHRSHYSQYDYNSISHYIFYNYNGVVCVLLLICFVLSLYTISIFIDQIRIIIWKFIVSRLSRHQDILTYKLG